MREAIGPGLTLTRIPRSPDLGEYDWFDLEWTGIAVGKSRCRIEPGQLTIFSIMVYPEYEKHGYARAVIEHFKTRHARIVADRVRFTARDFWSRVGFTAQADGCFVWEREATDP